MAKKSPDKYDVAVGDRIRTLRIKAKMSQEKLAHHMGLTFQQVQKYEKGSNRIAPSRLAVVARVLNVPMVAFFGEDNRGNSVVIDRRLNTVGRNRVVDALVKLNNDKFETRLAHLLETIIEEH